MLRLPQSLLLLPLVPGLLVLMGPLLANETTTAARPNVVLIVADDLGYSDPGCFGGEIHTPALDRLAREGVRLTHFHNCGMCVVSRASMLTGQWWPRAQRRFQQTPLLPEKLHAAGYRTALIGKWHLNGHPLDRGFDHFFGFLGGFSDHFAGGKDYQLGRKPFTDFGTDFYSSDTFTDRAIRFVQNKPTGDPNQPFFLYLSYQAPHNPLQAPREDILKYRGRYLGGWQAVREARFARQKQLGIVPPEATLPAYPRNLPDWNSLSPEQRDLEDLRMAVFAAMVERMDRGIGRLIDALEQGGQATNTLILFLSDNGADSFSVVDAPMLKQGRLPGDPGSNWQPGTGWAYASVTPWRLYKISQHGGGITTGTVGWWPGRLGKPGRIESSPVHLIDIAPTFLELTGQTDSPSPTSPGSDTMAGESFAPLLKGRSWERKSPLFFQFLDNRAIRSSKWTLAEVDGSGWELFDAAADPLETRNLAAGQPEVVRDLSGRWLQWWRTESGKAGYQPESARASQHYKPQGDQGSGVPYLPSAMPARLSARLPVPP